MCLASLLHSLPNSRWAMDARKLLLPVAIAIPSLFDVNSAFEKVTRRVTFSKAEFTLFAHHSASSGIKQLKKYPCPACSAARGIPT
jgi:hypothetical protein